MAKTTTTLWPIEPHTQAKHKILRNYLGAWFGILSQRMPKVVYFDGFAGPGRYAGGEDGSPIIALDLAMSHAVKNPSTQFVLFFVEQDQSRLKHLESEITAKTVPAQVKVQPINSEFAVVARDLFNHIESQGAQLAPAFAFIDPFGFSGIPFSLVSKFLKYRSVEIFINIMADSINRFIEHPDDAIPQHIIDTFGTNKVIDILQSAPDRFAALRDLYQDQLRQHARFVRYFEMRDENRRIIYFLFFASNNSLGHKKMKEAFWKVDEFRGYTFSDATDPNQMVLFSPDPSGDVANLLQKQFCGKTVETTEIFTFINDDSAYLESHAKQALKLLECEQKITVNSQKIDGKKRHGKTFPEGIVITFI